MKFAEDFRGALGITLASARANLVPMAVLWALAGVSVGAYYLLTPFREMLEPVVERHRAWGWRAAFDQFVWTVAEIAVACGYGSANALRKVFAAETGQNPLAWRKRAE